MNSISWHKREQIQTSDLHSVLAAFYLTNRGTVITVAAMASVLKMHCCSSVISAGEWELCMPLTDR